MALFESLRIVDFDHLELAVSDLDRASELYLQMGFEKTATREIRERGLRSSLLTQNNIYIVLSQSTLRTDHVAKFVEAHGDGVISIGLRCEDAVSALEVAAARGAEIADTPKSFTRDFGTVQQASIKAFGDIRHAFVSRQGNHFLEGFEVAVKAHNRGYGLERITHLSLNIEKGTLEEIASFYEQVLGLTPAFSLTIQTDRTGMNCRFLESPGRAIRFALNEPLDEGSQIQESLNVNHGPGVQHVAFATNDLQATMRGLIREGIKPIESPELDEFGIFTDPSAAGVLLQAYSQNGIGSLFFEFVQRESGDSFGERAVELLFRAREQGQIRRGVLPA